MPQNYLFLDNVNYRINNGAWHKDDISVVQWELLKSGNNSKCDIEFEFFIDNDFDLTTPIYMLIETPQMFTFKLNGEAFEFKKVNYHFDKAIESCLLPKELLKTGKNTLSYHLTFEQSNKVYEQLDKCKYFETAKNSLSFDMEIEPIYLAGTFAVKSEITDDGDFVNLSSHMTIANFDKSVPFREFAINSLPFWAGKAEIQAIFEIDNDAEKYQILSCDLINLNVIKVKINGYAIGEDNHNYCQIKVPEKILKNGKNIITFELVSNLRNFMGPFHVPKEILTNEGISPGTFGKVANVFTGDRTPQYLENYCIKKTTIKNIKIKKG